MAKREAYFEARPPAEVTAEWLEQLSAETVLRNPPNLRRAALLVLDMQRLFVDRESRSLLPSAPAIVPAVLQLIDEFERHSRPVYLTRHTNTAGNAGAMSRWWGELIDPESSNSELIPALARLPLPVIEKHQYDAFHGTGLARRLRTQEVDTVVVAGVMTHLCCESTARAAFVRGFDVAFPVDATATYNSSLHRASARTLADGFAWVGLTRDLIGKADR